MRVTVGSQAWTSLDSIDNASSRLAQLQAQLSSGKRIQQPSDDPNGTVQAMALRSAMSRNDQYGTNASDASAWLSTADSTYNQIVAVVQQAQTAVVKGMNTGANDADANTALADEIDGYRSTLLSLSNSQYNGRPLFGGTTAGGAAYDSSGSYVGDTGTVSRIVGQGNEVSVSAAGPDVFGSGSGSLFSVLSQISTALRTDPSTLSGSQTALNSALSRISAAQSTEGAAYARVQQAKTTQTTQDTAMTTQLTGIENVDLADMAIQVSTANTTYQAALQTTASVRQMSLLDFLK